MDVKVYCTWSPRLPAGGDGEEIRLTFAKSRLMGLCHKEYWYHLGKGKNEKTVNKNTLFNTKKAKLVFKHLLCKGRSGWDLVRVKLSLWNSVLNCVKIFHQSSNVVSCVTNIAALCRLANTCFMVIHHTLTTALTDDGYTTAYVRNGHLHQKLGNEGKWSFCCVCR